MRHPLWWFALTGAWAHAASALREDLPASPDELTAPPDAVPGQAPLQAQAGVQAAAGFPAAPPQLQGPPPQMLAAPLVDPALPRPEELGMLQREQLARDGPAASAWQHGQPSGGMFVQQRSHPLLHGPAGPASSAGPALQAALPAQPAGPECQAPSASGPPAMPPAALGTLPGAAPGALGMPSRLAYSQDA